MIKIRTLEGRGDQQWLHNFHAPKEKTAEVEKDIAIEGTNLVIIL